MKYKHRILQLIFLLGLVVFSLTTPVYAEDSLTTETIVLLRHGEKPDGELGKNGQLNCQGLNRSLALAKLLSDKFGKVNDIFAPATESKEWNGKVASYVRPLVTIEPTSIKLGLPVKLKYTKANYRQLGADLTTSQYAGKTILIAWQHSQIITITQDIFKVLGQEYLGPAMWPDNDFDSLFVVKIMRDPTGKVVKVSFDKEAQELNSQPIKCRTN